MIQPPFNPILDKLIAGAVSYVAKKGKEFLERLIFGPQLNPANSAADIEKLSNDLDALRKSITQQIQPAIEKANESVAAYVDEQLFILDDTIEILSKYEISQRAVRQKLADIEHRLNDSWRDALRLRISLDDRNCREILMIPSGEKKAAEIARFTSNVITETLDKYADSARRELASLYVDLESEIARAVSRIEKTSDEYDSMIQAIDAKDNDRFERLIAQAQIQIVCCDAMIQKVRD